MKRNSLHIYSGHKKTQRHIELHFEETVQLETWLEFLTKFLVKHEIRHAGNHTFSLSSFDSELKACVVCSVIFCGIFFQGYKCDYCDCAVHLSCLTNSKSIQTCDVNFMSKKIHSDLVW